MRLNGTPVLAAVTERNFSRFRARSSSMRAFTQVRRRFGSEEIRRSSDTADIPVRCRISSFFAPDLSSARTLSRKTGLSIWLRETNLIPSTFAHRTPVVVETPTFTAAADTDRCCSFMSLPKSASRGSSIFSCFGNVGSNHAGCCFDTSSYVPMKCSQESNKNVINTKCFNGCCCAS